MSKSGKSIAFKSVAPAIAPAAEAWVSNRGGEMGAEKEAATVTPLKQPEPEAPKERMTRFTIDVPEGLHRRVKMQCAGRGQKMADVLRELLEREFPIVNQ